MTIRKMITLLLISQGLLICNNVVAQTSERSVKTLSGSKTLSTKVSGISGRRPDSINGGGVKSR
jgi:hypothetical protein